MKVGILTMHRVVNYGSFMQAYALKRQIEALGHEVEFRDFRRGEPRHLGEKVSLPGLWAKLGSAPRKLMRPAALLRRRSFRRRLRDCFEQVCWPLLGVSKAYDFRLQADAMVVGSDEVFNYTQNHKFGYVPCLFGHGIDAPIIASYAASAGYANWDDALRDGMVEEITAGLRRFSKLSVRDENTRALVELCLSSPPAMVIDPTLIHDFSAEMPAAPVLAYPYLLVYAYEGRMESPQEVGAIRAFAAREGLRLVSAGAYHDWCDDNVMLPPFDLLRLFADAAYVITDTFHGSIFAIMGRRRFATLVRDSNRWGGNANKVGYLLRQFDLASRIVPDMTTLADVLRQDVAYDGMAARHEQLKASSLDYLRSVFEQH